MESRRFFSWLTWPFLVSPIFQAPPKKAKNNTVDPQKDVFFYKSSLSYQLMVDKKSHDLHGFYMVLCIPSVFLNKLPDFWQHPTVLNRGPRLLGRPFPQGKSARTARRFSENIIDFSTPNFGKNCPKYLMFFIFGSRITTIYIYTSCME